MTEVGKKKPAESELVAHKLGRIHPMILFQPEIGVSFELNSGTTRKVTI